MSVQKIDLKVLNAFGSRLVTIGHRKECDEWYSYSYRSFLNDKNAFDTALYIGKTIADMNALNYSKRYKEKCESLSGFIEYKISDISIYQFLKTLQYIMYNTFDYEEYFNKEQKEVVSILKSLEKDIMSNIINMIPEYKESKWSEI